MEHIFKVGEKYRNRRGEYEVLSIDGPKMTIRYDDGQVFEAKVELQTRFWKIIQAEEASQKQRAQAGMARAASRKRKSRKSAKFQGLQEHDFQKGVTGTSWRARTALGGMLAQRMTDHTGDTFQSYAIYRRAEVHIAQPDFYHSKSSARAAKFVFQLDEQGAAYGFFIERWDGPMDETWHWPKFLEQLAHDAELQQKIAEAMSRLGLIWQVFLAPEKEMLLTATVKLADGDLVWAWAERDGAETLSWPDFVEKLRGLAPGQWCDLYLWTSMPKDEVLSLGPRLVDRVVETYLALLPLYQSCIR